LVRVAIEFKILIVRRSSGESPIAFTTSLMLMSTRRRGAGRASQSTLELALAFTLAASIGCANASKPRPDSLLPHTELPGLNGKVFYLYQPRPPDVGTEYRVRQEGRHLEFHLLTAPPTSRRWRAPVQAKADITSKLPDGKYTLAGSYYIVQYMRPLYDRWEPLQDSYLEVHATGKWVIMLESKGDQGIHRSILVEK
jgi:hypothetical protein